MKEWRKINTVYEFALLWLKWTWKARRRKSSSSLVVAAAAAKSASKWSKKKKKEWNERSGERNEVKKL